MCIAATSSPIACGRGLTGLDDPAATLHCRDLGDPSEATFAALVALVAEPGGAKSCGGCHNARTPVGGYDLATRSGIYDALTSRTEIIYGQVASGAMPEVGEPWSEEDLRLLRTWWCHGELVD